MKRGVLPGLTGLVVAFSLAGTASLAPRSQRSGQPTPQAPVGARSVPPDEVKGLLPWEDMTEGDWIYPVATRMATLEGHEVHYPTPTQELAAALEARKETAALRHLAEARLELGDRKGAVALLERWSEAVGPEAWAEAARWGASHREMGLAFRAAERALAGLPPEAKRSLADERIAWAQAHPEAADPLALRKARADMFPDDPAALEDWIRSLEKAGQVDAAEAALDKARALSTERRLLLRSDLLADHRQDLRAFQVLDAVIEDPWGMDVRTAYATRTDKASPTSPEAWRATLERAFDPHALVRLATYFEGKRRGDAAADLLRQMERRYESGFGRPAWLLVARLWREIDAVPEAFRARLAAAQKGTREEQAGDLAALAHLALAAGGRPLPWGTYNDESYRWVARVDRTPGFWTGGASFLLTGQDWKEALARLEQESLPERTFGTARVLGRELEARNGNHPELPALRVAIMARHVQRGEGKEALALLPLLEKAPPDVAKEARRQALLAMRQVPTPVAEELRLYRERLKALAPDGSKPEFGTSGGAEGNEGETWQEPTKESWKRVREEPKETYAGLLNDALGRMEERDRSHRTSLDLILGEMDRLPDAEGLWEELAGRLEGWNLDDDLGPRYEQALVRFKGPGWWSRAARWYARRQRGRDLRRLAEEIGARFRGSEIFDRTANAAVNLEIPEQPQVGGRVRLVPWSDFVRLKALERFPHSPRVFKEASGRLVLRSNQRRDEPVSLNPLVHRVVVDDALLDRRGWAILFVDHEERERYFADLMRRGVLEARLVEIEGQGERSPVHERILFEGWSRISRFERAAAPADRLAASYPGDGALARQVLSLHRSLAGLDPSHAAPARTIVERTAPALTDAGPLWTELGELEEERGRPEAASATWRKIVEGDSRNPDRVSELATLLWDYSHMAEALAVMEEGRKAMDRPRFMAFETGVLREEVRDVDGAIREYLASLQPEGGDCFCSYFEHDQRSLRRLAQLLGRGRVRQRVEARIASLTPGVRADEQVLASLFPLGTIELPDRVAEFDVDDWIDVMDMPRDPMGRLQRAEQQAKGRPLWREGIEKVGAALKEKTLAMVVRASDVAFLDAAESAFRSLPVAQRTTEDETVFHSTVMARRAELAATEEARVALEVERAHYLVERGRREDADRVWERLGPRIRTLPEGAPRMRAEVDRASYLERTAGVGAAAEEWKGLSSRYPWSLGILEDHLAFLNRNGRGAEVRAALEAVLPRAASGHREALLERLARESLEAKDLGPARRAVEQLAAGTLDDDHRLGTDHLLARLSLKENPAFDPFPLAKTEAGKLKPEHVPDLYAQLARAADAEQSWGLGMSLWIEALNRRLEREWIPRACFSADKAGKSAALREFFEKQQARSPRDVRWAVAVREIRLHQHDLEGAIEMARAAVAVRPERENLWREAVALLVRAGRVKEAADYLEGWNKPRPGDEDVVRWRGELYARAGEGEKVLTLEKQTLDAFSRQPAGEGNKDQELRDRRVRVVQRLREYGYPRLAWRFVTPKGDLASVASSPLGGAEQAELALQNGKFLALLRHRAGDEFFRSEAARALRDYGKPEAREEAQAFLMAQLFATSGSAAPRTAPQNFSGDEAALTRWWPFVTESGLEGPMRRALAHRYLEASPGPWQADAPFALIETVGRNMVGSRRIGNAPVRLFFEHPDLPGFWFRDLARRDRSEELGAFVEPRVQELLARVRSNEVLPPESGRLAWAPWLDERAAFESWMLFLKAHPERLAEIGVVLADRRLWDRFWLLAARGWDISPLVAALPDEVRFAWFRHWQVPSPLDNDLVVRARGESVEAVSRALGRLVAGSPGAEGDPLIVKLRGPRTVGAVLGSDAAWVWPEFTARRNAKGESLETGEDRVIGQRADAGRLPGPLWGDRPGEAWYVLETLARFRQKDAEAPFMPLEVTQRGRESLRSLAAVRLAESLGDHALAAAIDEASPVSGADLQRLAVRLRIAEKADGKEKANALIRAEVRRLQATANETVFRALRRLAEDSGLDDPLKLLDPGSPVSPALLAFLHDRFGSAEAGRFQPKDVHDFRAALAARWRQREASLDAPRVRYYLSELWLTGAAPLPRMGLRKLGRLSFAAGDWLDRQPAESRAEALGALTALPDPAKLLAMMDAEASRRGPGAEDDVARLLRLRLHLSRGEDERVLALVDEMLAQMKKPEALSLAPFTPVMTSEEAAEGEVSGESGATEGGESVVEEEASEEPAPTAEAPSPAADPVATRLLAWLAPFRESKRTELVESRFREALAQRRETGPVPVTSWALALAVTKGSSDREALLSELENSWIRGDWASQDVGSVVEVLAKEASPASARWLERWPQAVGYDAVARRARVLARLKDGVGVHRLLIETRRRGAWTAAEEVRAFDLWRTLATPPPASATAKSIPRAGTGTKPASASGPASSTAQSGASAASKPTATAAAAAPPTWTRALPFWKKKLSEIPDLAAHLRAHPHDVLAARAALRTVAPGDEEAMRAASAALECPAMDGIGDRGGDQALLRIRIARGWLARSLRAARSAEAPHDADVLSKLRTRRMPRAEIDATLSDLIRLAPSAGGADNVLAQLEDRDAPRARALRQELRQRDVSRGTPSPFRIAEGRPAPYRPRDLDWSVVMTALDAEAAR